MQLATEEVGSTTSRYQILTKLAVGGMAEIFLARGGGTGVERYCVLKRMLPVHASDREFVGMFIDEARLAAQLDHPNIAQVYDIGKLDGLYYFTMEYVHGETVSSLIHRAHGLRRALSLSVVLTIVAGVAAGLHHAHFRAGRDGHGLGIVHRDVSPSNLMVSYDGAVKVVDFGVAKALHRTQETRSGTIKGKVSYLSPEQCRGQPVDRRSDLFSLGICLWELLTTERLYKRASDFETMRAIVTEIPPPPSTRRPDVPREVDALVARLLAKRPDARFQRADELVEAIEVVAAQVTATLSSSSLGRFMRELFGQRPEPWLDLEGDAAGTEAVTVKCDSILPAIAPGQRDSRSLPLAAPPPTDHAIVLLQAEPPHAAHRLAPRASRSSEFARWSSASESTERYRRRRALGNACVLFAVTSAIASVTIALSVPIGSEGSAGEPSVLSAAAPAQDAPVPVLEATAAPPAEAETIAPAPDREVASRSDGSRDSAPPMPQSSEPPRVTVRRTARRDLQDAGLARLYAAGRYYQVVVQCSAGALSAERAPLCFIAACHAENEVKAHEWLALLPAARRTQLVANCKQFGVDVQRPARPIPVADCAADPALCAQ